MAKTWVGISGWTFPAWRGTFYPKDLTQKRELEFASRAVNSIEINGTFYSLQRPSSFQTWYDAAPDGFKYAVKAPQFITHILRLKNAEEPLNNFLASGLLCLKEKLGPILWQFPPNVVLKDNRFEKFLKLLPHDGRTAAKRARQHGKKVEGRAFTDVKQNFPVRHAFEFRHPSFLSKTFLDLLAAHNVAFVCAHEGGKKAPYTEEVTADFQYVRLHGEGKAYSRGYPDREIARWEKKISGWNKSRRDVFIYFSNEAKLYSPAGALKLMKRLDIEWGEVKKRKAG
jgi:uncharacterized protein YecE (DUF72 family)